MTTMNNEDPADPSVHVPRVLDAADDPLPQPRVPNHVLECIYANGVGEVAAQGQPANEDFLANSKFVKIVPCVPAQER